MNAIQVFVGPESNVQVREFLEKMKYKEVFRPEQVMETHYFIVNRTDQTYQISNVSRRLSKRLDAEDNGNWEPMLTEFILDNNYIEYYPARLKAPIFKKTEAFRREKNLSKSSVVNFILSDYLKDFNPDA